MKKELILSPEALYYMGTQLQAKYIDYAYIAMMEDIQHNHALYESSARAALADQGVLTEDFSGRIEVDSEARALLEPIFFGEMESSLEQAVRTQADGAERSGWRLHFKDGHVTAVRIQADGIHIQAAEDADIQAWIRALLPPGYDARQQVFDRVESENINRVITVQNVRIGVRSTTTIYVEYQNCLLQELDNGKAEAMTAEQFCQNVYQALKGE